MWSRAQGTLRRRFKQAGILCARPQSNAALQRPAVYFFRGRTMVAARVYAGNQMYGVSKNGQPSTTTVPAGDWLRDAPRGN